MGISGAGAQATNIILTRTNAYVADSDLTSGLGLSVFAENDASIEATILSVAFALGVGAVGAGAAIGVALASNYIGQDPHAVENATYSTDTNDVAAINVAKLYTLHRVFTKVKYMNMWVTLR